MSQDKHLSKKIYKYLPFNNNTTPKIINIKSEYDINKDEINTIEKLIDSKIEDNIGSGGFSVVKKVFNHEQNKYFALKVINLDNKKFKKRPEKNKELINNEISIQKILHSSYTVKLEKSIEFKKYFLLLMEYCDNIDLRHFMKNFHTINKHLQFSELLCGFFMIQILNATYYLWMQSILHRDLKPENIMLTNDYNVKIGDFSLSKRVDKKSNFTTSKSGTIPYLAPECFKQKKSTISGMNSYKTDMFSIGVIMYFFLFNSHPFQYQNSLDIKNYKENFNKVSPSYQGNTITKCCREFLSKCLAIKIKKRLSIEDALKHNWILKIKDKINEIKEKFSHDPNKMISVLNNTKLDDSFFDGDKNINTNATTTTDNENDYIDCSQNTYNNINYIDNNKHLSSKRKRSPFISSCV